MADDVKVENLGEYQDLFFKLGGTDKTAEEFAALTDPKEIDRIKEVYEAWVAKYINVGENTPEDQKEQAAEQSYFDKREEEVAAMPETTRDEKNAKGEAQKKLHEEYVKAGKTGAVMVSYTDENGKEAHKLAHYDPKDSQFEGQSLDDIRAYFKDKFEKEAKGEEKEDDKEKEEPEVLNVGEEKEDSEKDENQDWKDEKEAFWKEHCGEHAQECERDPEDKDGLSLDIYKNKEDQAAKKPMAKVHYSSKNKASIQGADGKVADYSVFLGLAKDAKRNNQAINFDGEMSPEFAAKLKLACEEVGVAYQNAPEGKIDVNAFEGELSPETKAKLEEYNQSQDKQPEPAPKKEPEKYEEFLKDFQEKIANGQKGFDISMYEGAKAIEAYAAAKVAEKEAQEKNPDFKATIEGKPEGHIDYNGQKIVEDADGKKTFEKSDLSKELEGLPKEAKEALGAHNQEVRQGQIDALRKQKEQDVKDGKLDPNSEEGKLWAAKETVRGITNKYKEDHGIEGKMTPEQAKEFFTELKKDDEQFKKYAEAQVLIYDNRSKNMTDTYAKGEHTAENGDKKDMKSHVQDIASQWKANSGR